LILQKLTAPSICL